MPQDKRLIVTKAVIHKIQRLCGADADAAAAEGVFIEFVVPAVVVAQCPELLTEHVFQLPKRTYAMNGRTTCLIVPRIISGDAFKINKRHGYYDAVVTAEAICKRDDTEAARRAVLVSKTFSHFVVDDRIVSKLPPCITAAASLPAPVTPQARDDASSSAARPGAQGGKKDAAGKCRSGKVAESPPATQAVQLPKASGKCITALRNLEDRTSLTFRLSQGVLGGVVRAKNPGQLTFRVGHAGMTAGDLCENAKSFIFALKREFPTVWKYIHEFKMTSRVTEPIRFMEVHIRK
ncbi:hypothetical protein TraAM80_06363 [Trypanosoma rangeli]|uniref:Ribosomal protein L1p/L10e family n=1 Tax=Trypanosoma rangeli TaxID=5698 RepID=A0A3R7N930_TRYRA|nr:uncharacterized protein TraAM80_06363 [Trypanosoma rangeli]RNF02457.1 hypothetical protein TraAM80_06363 [Trypanosoma rangeli]|eukprot:RNF02457.1 hypothetical protein TraAM80_06363 [Trypanosoma rangeli]